MKAPKNVTAMVECPKGSSQKFDYDPSEKLLECHDRAREGKILFPRRISAQSKPIPTRHACTITTITETITVEMVKRFIKSFPFIIFGL